METSEFESVESSEFLVEEYVDSDTEIITDEIIEEELVEYDSSVQVLTESVDLMSADVVQRLDKCNTLLSCVIVAMFIMYFRTIIYSIRRGC